MRVRTLLGACALAVVGCGDDSNEGATQAAGSTSTAGGAGGEGAVGGGDPGGAGGAGGSGPGGGGSGGAPPCALGTTWTTLDDFVHSPGQQSNPAGIAVDAADRVFAAGIAQKGTFEWVVRRSEDGGVNWETVEAMAGGANDVAADAAGRVFVVGGVAGERVVRRSIDGGDTWTTVDSRPLGTGGNQPCNTGFVSVASDGVVYVGGSCDLDGWTLRRSTDGGDTWTTVDTFVYEMGAPSRMSRVGADLAGHAYAGGNGTSLGGLSRWIVRQGDALGTWGTVDELQLPGGVGSRALGFGGTSRFLALGSAHDAGMVEHWIVRALDGTTWSTIDDLAATDALGERKAIGAFEDGAGAIYVVGIVADAEGTPQVRTRRSPDGIAWTDIDTFAYVPGSPSGPAGGRLAADSMGNVYGLVRGVDAAGDAHWLVRKLACD